MNPRDPLQFALLNRWQRDFPLCREPFDVLAGALDTRVETVLDACARLCEGGAISRIGGVFGAGAGGASMLAAMAVPADDIDAVAALVSAHPGVNHNYERRNPLNLWFVITGRSEQHVEGALQQFERATGLPVLRLPMLQPYGVDLAFDLRGDGATDGARAWRQGVPAVAPQDVLLAAAVEQGLPLLRQPFDAWARALDRPVDAVMATLHRWVDVGTLSRFGVVVRHHELNFSCNAMAVFDVPDELVDACGLALARQPGVTLAYGRARAPGWPYNLYGMVHGTAEDAVRARLAKAVRAAGLAAWPGDVLFSVRRFKQTGGRRFGEQQPAPQEGEALAVT